MCVDGELFHDTHEVCVEGLGHYAGGAQGHSPVHEVVHVLGREHHPGVRLLGKVRAVRYNGGCARQLNQAVEADLP